MARPVNKSESYAKMLYLETKYIICTHQYKAWAKHLATKARRRFSKEVIYNGTK